MDGAPAAPAADDRAERLFAWGAWALLALASLGFANRFAVEAPFYDDFDLVPVLSGESAASPSWFWRQESDHRSPLPKVVTLAAAALSGRDFSGTVLWNFSAMAAAAGLLLLAARRLRGRTEYFDAVFPILLMNGGVALSLLRVILVQGATRTLLYGGAVLLVAGVRGPPTARRTGAVALCALGMALTGSAGLMMGLVLAAWALVAAGAMEASPRARLATRAVAASVFAVGVAYFVGFERLSGRPFDGSPVRAAKIALQVLGQALGPAGGFGWAQPRGVPFGVGFPPLLALGVAAVTAAAFAAGSLRLARGPERLRTLGLLACAAGPVLAAVAIGFAKSDFAEDYGLQNHYGIIAAPGFAAALLLIEVAAPESAARWARFVVFSVFAVACALLVFNLQLGYRACTLQHAQMVAFEADARRGASPDAIADAHGAWLYWDDAVLRERLAQMERCGVAPFPSKPR